jgi:hypothetical protein
MDTHNLNDLQLCPQVIREAADQGIRKMLFHCQTPRAIPLLVNTLKTDKNACIRSSSASYLAQVCLFVFLCVCMFVYVCACLCVCV